ncbi:MAG: methyltransferase domain-containing protein [Gammaproteobacteria bacterium]|nr:methyltransferase domain-containing protein [Gammaproteobacteria bacterium]
MSDLISLNRLKRMDNDVYCFPAKAVQDFGYSDGQEVERYLLKTFEEVDDLSSRSNELQSRIIDWPSEYHLTSDRSNLLRGFDLSFAKTALELGSGCGAISRYLGEQGVTVDAIEGSAIRADLGRRRCKGLNNVRIINANYNKLKLPKKHYDLVLFVGVIEYAQRFKPKSKTNRDAALEILKQAKQYLSPNGVVIVAIENRLGLKYILGHHEDHYSKRYVGINGYPDSAGIATYSHKEWEQLALDAGFGENSFTYPFPDYKIPRVVLSEDYVDNNPHAFNHLEGMVSRDYTVPAKRSVSETIGWQAASNGNYLHTVANSFCILLGNDKSVIDKAISFDFCHAPGPGRKSKYAVLTRKLRNQDIVTKTPLLGDQRNSRDSKESGLVQDVSDQTYLYGNLLSAQWLRTILIYVRREEFNQLLAEYYDFLGERQKKGLSLEIDLLPINIVIDAEQRYQVFDQEWQVDWPITREFLLFRALLTFIITNWVYLKEFLGWLELYTVRDFINYGFNSNGLQLEGVIDDFIAQENHFQSLIAADNRGDVGQLLTTVFDFTDSDKHVYSACSWHGTDSGFTPENRTVLPVIPDPDPQSIIFDLPATAKTVQGLRFDPFDIRKTEKIGFFSILRIDLIEVCEGEERIRWGLHGSMMIAEHCRPNNAIFEELGEKNGWLAVTDFPNIEIELDDAITISQSSRFKVRIDMGFCESPEYLLAHQRYLTKIRYVEQLERDLKSNIEQLSALRARIARIRALWPVKAGLKMVSVLRRLAP